MPFAVTLCFDRASAEPLEDLWRILAEQKIDCDRHDLGYAPHITLGVYPDETSADQLAAALERIAAGLPVLPVTLAGIGCFPGETSILWAVPVITPDLLDCHTALQSALPGLPVHPHYRAGSWVPHVTLSGGLRDPGPALTALTTRWRPVSGFLSRLELLKFRPVVLRKSLILDGRGAHG